MDSLEVRTYWEENVKARAPLARMGGDVYRDALNTPWFFRMLPDVRCLDGIDMGCGEGCNTRMAASAGARMTAFDAAGTFLRYAQQAEREEPMGIRYCQASGGEIPFGDATFDFAIATMSLMDMPELEAALSEAF